MRKIDAAYDLMDNNCQLMTLNILNQICEGAVQELYSSWRLLHLKEPQKVQKSPPVDKAFNILLDLSPTLAKRDTK